MLPGWPRGTARECSEGESPFDRRAWVHAPLEEARQGGREIERKVDLETMPLYVRAGAILPLGPVRQYAEEPVDAPLTLIVYPGADGASSLYEDDGKTFAYRKGEWMRIEMGCRKRNSLP